MRYMNSPIEKSLNNSIRILSQQNQMYQYIFKMILMQWNVIFWPYFTHIQGVFLVLSKVICLFGRFIFILETNRGCHINP